jgi:hypothetical protein
MKTERFNSLQELEYSGKLEARQFAKESNVVKYEHLSATQNELYKRCLIGLDYYTPEELYAMNSAKKIKISKRHKAVQITLNLWKQEIVNMKANAILSAIFPNAPLITDITNDYDTDPGYINKMTFKELGLTRENVIDKLICSNFLPRNFAAL